MKSIFTFDSAKDYLRHYIDTLPKKGWGQVQSWATHLGVQPSYVSQILSGLKTLNSDQAIQLSQVIGLSGIELDYFILLVEKEKAGHHLTKNYYETKMKSLKSDSKNLAKRLPQDKVLTAEQKSIFYSSWLYSAARMLCSLPGGQTLPSLTQKLDLEKEEAHTIVSFLCDTGLCEKKGTHYFVGARKTHLEKNSPHVRTHWLNWHLKAMQKFDNVQANEMIYSAPFTISEKDFEALHEELVKFIKNLSVRVENTEPEHVALLNIDFLRIL